jgi:hypothetical protein
MSGRAIPAAVNWASLLKQTAPVDRKLMAAFKLKSDTIASAYTKAAGFKREIDWSSYEQNINNKELVADFKAKYEATEIPVPTDDGLGAELEAKAAADEVAVANYVAKVDGQIANASTTMDALNALPPFEQMTQADVLFYFPQLCGNVTSIKFSENDPRNVIAGGDIRDLPKQELYGTQPIGVQEKEGLKISHQLYRLDEHQYPEGKYPAFFSSFPSAEFNESFALADPLIQWAAIGHHPEFDAHVNAIQEAHGVEPGLRKAEEDCEPVASWDVETGVRALRV